MIKRFKDSPEAMRTPNQFLLYTSPNGAVKVFYRDETVWLTQKVLAELFGAQVPRHHQASEEYLRFGRVDPGNNCFQNGNGSHGRAGRVVRKLR